jgi:outer membrane lipoprotein carrier protein
MIICFPVNKKVFGASNTVVEAGQLLEKIIQGVEKRYDVSSFSATFDQESTLKAMEITDTGNGRITVKRPWKMKWEYESPEKQIYVTDGTDMWIYRPEDNQVQIGKAKSFFTGVVRAVFLLDMEQIKKYFSIALIIREDPMVYTLKLLPKEEIADVSEMYLSVSKKTYDVVKIAKYNASGDEVTYTLSDFKFNGSYPDSLFRLKIPEGADVQYFDEQLE